MEYFIFAIIAIAMLFVVLLWVVNEFGPQNGMSWHIIGSMALFALVFMAPMYASPVSSMMGYLAVFYFSATYQINSGFFYWKHFVLYALSAGFFAIIALLLVVIENASGLAGTFAVLTVPFILFWINNELDIINVDDTVATIKNSFSVKENLGGDAQNSFKKKQKEIFKLIIRNKKTGEFRSFSMKQILAGKTLSDLLGRSNPDDWECRYISMRSIIEESRQSDKSGEEIKWDKYSVKIKNTGNENGKFPTVIWVMQLPYSNNGTDNIFPVTEKAPTDEEIKNVINEIRNENNEKYRKMEEEIKKMYQEKRKQRKNKQTNARPSNFTAAEKQALNVLGLEDNPSKDEITTQYKKLLKKYHPDSNQGDRSYEGLLRQVQTAYDTLKKRWK